VRGRLGRDFDDFVREASTGLLRTAVLLAPDRASAEDLLQTALVRTARRWSAASADPHAYVRRVLVNLAKDGWRNRSRRPVEVAAGAGPEPRLDGPAEQVVLRDEIVRAVAQLPARQRVVLVLRYFEDRPVAEVADLVGCSEGTVKSQTHHALARLRALLDPTLEATSVDR
jgi:RNA polymerase sigma-70 factor (sigma-E family)